MMFTTIMGMTTFSIMTSIIVLYFYHHICEKRPPRLLRQIFFKFLARGLCMMAYVPDENNVIPLRDDSIHTAPGQTTRDGGITVQDEAENVYGGDVMKTRPMSAHRPAGGDSAYILEILEHMRMMSRRAAHKDRSEMILVEWKAIAMIVDRAFFWVAFIVIVTTVPTFLLREDESHAHS